MGQPWCAMFVSWCANKAGVLGSIVPRYASCEAGADWYRNRGRYRSRFHGKMNFVAGICEKLKVSEIIENSLSKRNGRKPDIPHGTLAEMMIVNLCDSHKPLYLIQEYYEQKDLEGIFNTQIDIEQLNDDRFSNYLDQL